MIYFVEETWHENFLFQLIISIVVAIVMILGIRWYRKHRLTAVLIALIVLCLGIIGLSSYSIYRWLTEPRHPLDGAAFKLPIISYSILVQLGLLTWLMFVAFKKQEEA